MDLLKKVASLFSPTYKDDPFFGRLRFQKVGFWEGRKFFAPENGEYEITIDGGLEHPTESQRAFFREIETKYPELKKELTKEFLELLQNWKDDFSEEEVWDQCSLQGIGIPDIDAGKTEWELVYELTDDGHCFCPVIENWEIRGISIDG